MERLTINILGISDMHWSNNGNITTKNGIIYYTGSTRKMNRYGVGIMVTNNINNSVINFSSYSDRIIMIQLQTNNEIMNIIQTTGGTADKDDEKIAKY